MRYGESYSKSSRLVDFWQSGNDYYDNGVNLAGILGYAGA